MVSSVRQRPNHYQTLGLTPAASEDEVAKAFARKMNAFRWHPAGAAAQVWIAYETLRDRIRRADYDRALGLAPKPQREWTMAVTRQQWTPFIAPVPTSLAQPPALEPQVHPDPPVDPRLESIAATLRELSKPATIEGAQRPAPQVLEQWRPDVGVEPLIERILAVDHEEKAQLRRRAARSPGWRKPALAVGGLLLGAGAIGAYAGLSVSNQEGSGQATATIAAKPAIRRHAAAAVEPAAAPLRFEPAALQQSPAMAHSSATRIASPPHVRQAQATTSDAAQPQPDAVVSDPALVDPLAPQSAPTLPISNKVAARTIDRIGYSCGEISSSTPVEGSPGAFDLICSSGQTFRASPVHGRYHFRRAG